MSHSPPKFLVALTLIAKARGEPEWERMDERGRQIFGAEWDEHVVSIETQLAETVKTYKGI